MARFGVPAAPRNGCWTPSRTQHWNISGRQVYFAEKDRNQAPEIDDDSMEGWDGYAASRRRITRAGWTRTCAAP